MECNFVSLQLIQNMSADVIEKHVDASELAKIKGVDQHPQYQVFRIAHTGKSESHIVGFGSKILQWFGSTIKAIHNAIKVGCKAWYNHAENTNSPAGRKELGRIVGKFIEEDGNSNVDSYAIVYRYPELRDYQVDAASYEGVIVVPDDLTVEGWVPSPDHVREVSGIALCDTKKGNRPAFPRSTLQLQIQNAIKSEEDAEIKKEENMEITKEDILEFIKKNKVVPSDLFSKEILKVDVFVTEIARENNQNTHGVVLRYKDKIDNLEAQITKYKEETETRDKKLQEANIKATKLLAKEQMETIFTERKLTEKTPVIAKMIKRELGKFNPTGDEKKLTDEINKFIDQRIDDYTALEKEGILLTLKDDTQQKDADKKPGSDEAKKDSGKDYENADITDPNFQLRMAERVKEMNK